MWMILLLQNSLQTRHNVSFIESITFIANATVKYIKLHWHYVHYIMWWVRQKASTLCQAALSIPRKSNFLNQWSKFS